MKIKKVVLFTVLVIGVVALSASAAMQYGIQHTVGDIQLYNNEPNSDYGTAIGEEPTIRLDGSAGVIEYGAGDSTATSVSAGFIAADRFGLGAADCYALEGTTADDFELSICATDPTADVIATMPIMSATAYAVVASTLVTNSAEIENSVWMESNTIKFEGTLDAFETSITATDATVDRTITLPNSSLTVGAFTVECTALLIADMVDQSCWISDGIYTVTAIDAVWQVQETTGTLTVIMRKQEGTEAPASGQALNTAINVVATAETTTTVTLTGTGADLIFADGDRIGMDFTDDAAGELAGLVIVLHLTPTG